MNDLKWYEVWADEMQVPPYLLLLMCFGNNSFIVTDQAERKTISQATDYDGARAWLLEDEYTLVRGRTQPD
jgi:hypothetical protein